MQRGLISMTKSAIDWIALILVIVGAINWGLVGILDFNIVDKIFGIGSTIATIIYILVGLSGIWMIYYVAKE